MPSIREFLGDGKIRELEFMGYSPYAIEALAKKEYELKKQELVEKGISEKVAEYATQNRLGEAEAQKINEDANRGVLGRFWDNYSPLKVLQTQAAKAGEFLFAPNELKGHTKAGEIIEENRRHFDKVKEANENWAIANPDKWNIASVAGRVAEGFTDPINLIPIASSANLGRKMFYYASTGALSGAGDSWARDENVAEGALYGGVGGAVLGPVTEYLIKGVSGLITKARDARIKEATSQADIDALNNNDFLKVDAASRVGRDNDKEGFGVKEYIDFYLHNSGEDVRKRVYADYLAGKEKSVIDDEKFNDIKNFKSGIEFLSNPSKTEEYFAPLQMERDAVMDSIYKARENSLTQYADMQKTTHKIVKENPNLNSRMLTELVNLTHKPTKEEAFVTSLINNGQGVENRLSGYRILYAIENSFDFNIPAETFYARLKKAGFVDEAAEAFTDSYTKKDLSIANEFIGVKVGAEGEKFVIDRFIKSKEAEAKTNETGRAESAGEARGAQDSLFDLGDNASRTEAGQAGDAQIPQNGRSDTPVGSEDAGRAKINETMEELGAVKFDDADNARFNSEQVVSKQTDGDEKAIEKAYGDIDELSKEYDVERFLEDSVFANRKDFGETPIKADAKTAAPSDTAQGSDGLKPIEYSLDENIISQNNLSGDDEVGRFLEKLKKGESAELVKAISSSKDIALKLEPAIDILSIVKDFSSPINTPIFTSKISIDKMLNHLAEKVDADRRLNYINLVKSTLENPLFITKKRG